MELYFIPNKIKAEPQVSSIHLQVGDEELKRENFWT